MLYWCPVNLTAFHFADFEISRAKGDFLKTTIGHFGLNGGSNNLTVLYFYLCTVINDVVFIFAYCIFLPVLTVLYFVLYFSLCIVINYVIYFFLYMTWVDLSFFIYRCLSFHIAKNTKYKFMYIYTGCPRKN